MNGLKAVEKYKSRGPNFFKFVFIDLNMSVMDEIKICELIREHEK